MTDTIVIGSGPAGVAGARALIERGRSVVLIDVGFTGADPAAAEAVPPPGRLERKLTGGSDYPYRSPKSHALVENDTALVPSYARGGFSTVWGATMLPYDDDDLAGWPLTKAELQDPYAEVASYVPIAAGHDGLAERYPLHGPEGSALRRATPAQTILDRLESNTHRLAARGIEFGGSRLAVNSGRPAPAVGCVYCRGCLHGCSFGHIYSAGLTLGSLIGRTLFTYRPGLFVERLFESEDGVTACCQDVATGARTEFRARRVLVAAGAIGSTALLQRSGMTPAARTILDSALAIVPIAVLGKPASADEPQHSLSQLFLRLSEEAGGGRPACIQLYAHDPTIVERARSIRPGVSRVAGPALALGLRSLVMAFLYLHSDLSEAIRCETDAGGTRLSRIGNDQTQLVTAGIVRRLARATLPCGLFPLARLRYQGSAGQGFHVGGSLPMRRHPARGETDLLGRPHQLQRVHVVDASVFPTIPAGPITYSIMANATRIAGAVTAQLSIEAA